MKRHSLATILVVVLAVVPRTGGALAQPLGTADTGAPGDAMIRAWLAARTARIEDDFADDLRAPLDAERQAALRAEYLRMLGLDPLPERTPLEATVTGTLDRGDYVVEKIHFQSLPGAHVAANLYRPAHAGGRLPAVLYLCGHSKGKVNPPYQANPRWFGQHG